MRNRCYWLTVEGRPGGIRVHFQIVAPGNTLEAVDRSSAVRGSNGRGLEKPERVSR